MCFVQELSEGDCSEGIDLDREGKLRNFPYSKKTPSEVIGRSFEEGCLTFVGSSVHGETVSF